MAIRNNQFRRQFLALGLVLLSWPVPAERAHADLLYWTVATGIRRADVNGNNVADVITGVASSGPAGIAVDDLNGHLYWTESTASDIHRADFSGSNIATLFDSSLSLRLEGIAVDQANGNMYWGEVNRLARDDISPSTPQNPSTVNATGTVGVALTDTHVYWASGSTIRRAELSGANATILVSGLGTPWGVAIDPVNGRIYWTDRQSQRIERADLNGANRSIVVSGLNAGKAKGITLDVAGDRMFWLNTDSSGGDIFRSTLAGANQISILSLAGNSDFIAFSAVPEPSAWGCAIAISAAASWFGRLRRRARPLGAAAAANRPL